MNSIHVDIRLRPIRFGFLVRPDDEAKILEIFRINTCLWGGMFNPIIPFIESVPSWWDRHASRSENANQIINGYLNFFEPDFLVEAEEGLANGLSFDSERVLHFEDILVKPGEWDGEKFGLSVHNVYSALYHEIFRFETRHPPNIVSVDARDDSFATFVASNFGSFPIQEQFRYFERNYKEVFNPEHIILDSTSLSKLYRSVHDTPLSMSHAKLRVDYHDQQEFRLFILNAKETIDLVDFWNLRATHDRVMAVPVQWIEELSPFCKELILGVYQSLNEGPNRRSLRPISIFARSIPSEDIDEIFGNYLRVDEIDNNTLQTFYPVIWRKPSEWVVEPSRPTLEADRKELNILIEENNSEIQFDWLSPGFANEHSNQFQVANVVRLHDWRSTGHIATVFPCDHRNSPFFKSFRYRVRGTYFLPTTEGLVTFPKRRNTSDRWNLDVTTTFDKWFKANQVSAAPSDAGMATQQIIQTLGGLSGVGCLAHKGVIEFLDKISDRPVTKTAKYQKFRDKIKCAVDSEPLSERIFKTLVERKVVELGLELKCSKCGSWSWYSIEQLDYSLTCSLCLRQFDFPVTNPSDSKHSRWAYRVIGPFAQPDYAKGGYAAALAIRFFTDVIGESISSEATWWSGQELEFAMGEKLEADFILWHQRKGIIGLDFPTETVFGEAKSFKRIFKQEDIAKMRQLAERFPGSILTFAALKEGKNFAKKEIERLKKLAAWGREYDQDRQQSRAPVIILTETELFAEYSLEETWKKKGGKHEQLIELPAISTRLDNLRILADLTQQLYLDMPSYGSFRRDNMRKSQRERIMTDTLTNQSQSSMKC